MRRECIVFPSLQSKIAGPHFAINYCSVLMPLHSISESELRDHCRRIVEALELWLRRLIHDCLSKAYGLDYINATDEHGKNVINNSITGYLKDRIAAEPTRYARPIDAATLEQEVKILCKRELYDTHFKDALKGAFPDGAQEAKTFLNRLISPRNRLYHAQPISVRQSEQVICYSNDVIDSLKEYYRKLDLTKEYNAPVIVRVVDSFGASFHPDQIHRNNTGAGLISRKEDKSATLRPGEFLWIEVEIDPSFDPSSFTINWNFRGQKNIPGGNRLLIEIQNEHISPSFAIYCNVVSGKDWHRLGDRDDSVAIIYKVLPPL